MIGDTSLMNVILGFKKRIPPISGFYGCFHSSKWHSIIRMVYSHGSRSVFVTHAIFQATLKLKSGGHINLQKGAMELLLDGITGYWHITSQTR